MLQYFQYYPQILFSPRGDLQEQLLTNIIHKVDVRKEVSSNIGIFYPWVVGEGDTPEVVADKYYGSTQYQWVVLFSNNIIDPYYDWVMADDVFQSFLADQYGSVRASYQTVDHYEDIYGNVIDLTTYNTLPADERKQVMAYDYWHSLNEAKRNIRLISSDYVPQIEKELLALLQNG